VSIKSLKKGLGKDKEIHSVTRKELSILLTERKFKAIQRTVSKTVEAQNFFLKTYSGIRSIQIISFPRALRDSYVNNGLPVELAELELQDRQWKIALERAFDTLSSIKAIADENVRDSLVHTRFSENEKHLIRYLLKMPELLQLVLDGKPVVAEALLKRQSKQDKFNETLREAISEMNLERIFSWLRRRYREAYAKNKKPRIKKRRTYHLDPNMYSFIQNGKRCYIAIASLEPRKRILIPLTSRSLTKADFVGNIKVVLRSDGKVEVHRGINAVVMIPPPLPEANDKKIGIIAVDKGFTDLLHGSSGQKYGVGYGSKMACWSDSMQRTNSGRGRMRSRITELKKRIKSLGNNPNSSSKVRALNRKISRIQKNNLGSQKVDKKREFIKKEVQKEIGTAVNTLFKMEEPKVLGVEKLDFEGGAFYGKRINRLLKTWHKGRLQDALVKSAKTNCVRLEQVNPAYTSQLCRACAAVDARNRKGDQFDCVHCGHKADANFAASLNIFDRIFDPEIGLYTPHKLVKEILIQRYRLRLANQGLNEQEVR